MQGTQGQCSNMTPGLQ